MTQFRNLKVKYDEAIKPFERQMDIFFNLLNILNHFLMRSIAFTGNGLLFRIGDSDLTTVTFPTGFTLQNNPKESERIPEVV